MEPTGLLHVEVGYVHLEVHWYTFWGLVYFPFFKTQRNSQDSGIGTGKCVFRGIEPFQSSYIFPKM
jgi:hypothetical protein